jgi:hypothetical protein
MKKGIYKIRCDETVALKMGYCSHYFLGVFAPTLFSFPIFKATCFWFQLNLRLPDVLYSSIQQVSLSDLKIFLYKTLISMHTVDLILALKGIYLHVATNVFVQMACQAPQLSVTVPCSSVVSVRSDYWHFLCANARPVLLHVFVVLSVKILIF